MTENREDERIRSALNRAMSGLEENPCLTQRIMAASEGETKVKKKISIAAVLVTALLLTSVTALALHMSGWKIADYIQNVSQGKVDQSFESGFDQDLTLEVEGIRFHVRDAYAAGSKIILVTEITCTENDTTMILPDTFICDPDVTPAFVYIKELTGVDEEITIGEYARQKGLSMVHTSVFVRQKDTHPIVSGDEWIENDTTLLSISSANILEPENDSVEVELEVTVYQDDQHPLDAEPTTKTLYFNLPVDPVEEVEISVNQTITAGDHPVTLDRVVLMPTRLHTQIKFFYHTNSEQAAEELLNYRFLAVDPSSLDFLAGGGFSGTPEILGTENQKVYMYDDLTLGGTQNADRLYFQLLPIYTWVREGIEVEKGLTDVLVISIRIPVQD